MGRIVSCCRYLLVAFQNKIISFFFFSTCNIEASFYIFALNKNQSYELDKRV